VDLNLKDELALVSGSTAGIGLAIATALAHEGTRVIVNGRSNASVGRSSKGCMPPQAQTSQGSPGIRARLRQPNSLPASFPVCRFS
jgi:NAD(P)-dependent dehydrogenase (short-subunit alcohol dehydrogenase family)